MPSSSQDIAAEALNLVGCFHGPFPSDASSRPCHAPTKAPGSRVRRTKLDRSRRSDEAFHSALPKRPQRCKRWKSRRYLSPPFFLWVQGLLNGGRVSFHIKTLTHPAGQVRRSNLPLRLGQPL